jgi:photosystem II stability/assembly factor-like uncharacterized protein
VKIFPEYPCAKFRAVAFLLAAATVAGASRTTVAQEPPALPTAAQRSESPSLLSAASAVAPPLPEMKWRLIGPFRGGRAVAATGVPGRPNEYYFGAVAGGIWKTENAGRTWQPIFDGESVASIGALAIAPSSPDTIYAGTGEADMRSDISYGDGVYKSTDGGATWRNVGLRDSRHIGRILIDPRDPNIVLVAALGHAYGPNAERGVYRSTDGGATWTKILGKNDDTGAMDLCADPGNPQIVYASLWQVRRPPWSVYAPISGPGSGLYKSTDGGATWRQITGHGFPSDGVERIGIAVASGGNGNRVFALVDAKEGGLYRSDDAGENWRRVSSDHRIWQRGWYFGGVTADPRDPNIVYVANTALYRSADGGGNFDAIKGAPGGDDYHLLWIAPDDPQRMILATDQGVIVSVDGAKTWSSWYNQPTAQFYHVITDDRFPYWVYGAQQDSGTAAVESRSDYGQITWREWAPIGGDESGYIAPDPANGAVYGGGPFGGLQRFDMATGQSLVISPQPVFGAANTLRFTWTSPLVMSPQNSDVLYLGSQFVMRTDDRGMSWRAISPDLAVKSRSATATTNSGAGNPGTKEKPRGVVYTIAPSPLRAGEIWAGTDNGLIHLTTDEGKNWTDVTPAGLAEWSEISLIEASHFDASSAYAAVDRHQVDDYRPYIYRTRDSGKTWANVAEGLPANSYVHVVREDPVRKGLLFAGTETGVYFSLDDGDHWRALQINLPVAPIHDIAVHGDDVIVATHGRSFWILDDIEPLREWSDAADTRNIYLFHPASAYRLRRSVNHDTPLPAETPMGENPPAGAIIDYSLNAAKDSGAIPGAIALEILDAHGNLVRKFSSNDQPFTPSLAKQDPPEFSADWIHVEPTLSSTPGMHRFVWDLRYPRPDAIRYDYSAAAPIASGTTPLPEGPLALPAKYQAILIADAVTATQAPSVQFTVKMDPREKIPPEDLTRQLDLELKIDAALSQATAAYHESENLDSQLNKLVARLEKNPNAPELLTASKTLERRAAAMAGFEAEWPAAPSGFRNLNETLAGLAITVDSADSAPTAASYELFAACEKQLAAANSGWRALRQRDLPAFNLRLRKAGLAPIAIAAISAAGAGRED